MEIKVKRKFPHNYKIRFNKYELWTETSLTKKSRLVPHPLKFKIQFYVDSENFIKIIDTEFYCF